MNAFTSENYCPRILTCGHTFCSNCLTQMLRLHGSITCPHCSSKSFPGTVEVIPKNFSLLESIDASTNIRPKFPDSHEAHEYCCEVCEERHPATSQCVDCGELLCADVASIHSKFKATKGHRVLPLAEAQSQLKNNPLPVVVMCKEHPNKPYEFYDETCEKLLCVSCAILGCHAGTMSF
jgi:hypothetical protein